jgi:hypothetical protein
MPAKAGKIRPRSLDAYPAPGLLIVGSPDEAGCVAGYLLEVKLHEKIVQPAKQKNMRRAIVRSARYPG